MPVLPPLSVAPLQVSYRKTKHRSVNRSSEQTKE
jgi:hypothetical protein